ncbi:MAG: protein kinase, partial [Myxococcales bacterium]|nr:protein kinase [Myxococcales bacterium]
LIMDWGLAYPLPGPAGEGLRELLPDIVLDGSPDRPTGTPRYMSPEQVAGRELDERSDIYSLGVILYELLSLRSPYTATEFTHLLVQVSEGDIVPLIKTGPSVPDALIHVVARAMALSPDDRYTTVRELADDIETVLDGFTPHPASGTSMVMSFVPEFREPEPREVTAEEERELASGPVALVERKPTPIPSLLSKLPVPAAQVCAGMAAMALLAPLIAGIGWILALGLAAAAVVLVLADSLVRE